MSGLSARRTTSPPLAVGNAANSYSGAATLALVLQFYCFAA